jgi:hypothetical protein
VEEGLCHSLLRLVQNDRQIEQLREKFGGFSHRYRNLLNGMKMSLYLVRRGAGQPLPQWWAALEQNYRGIEQLLDQLQSIYRPMSLTSIRAPLRSLVQDRERVWSDWFASGCGSLVIVPPAQESAGEFDPMCLSMGFDALLRWRASAVSPDQCPRLTWRTGDGRFEVSWHEPGAPARSQDGARRHTRPRPSSPCATHQSLALPLLARVMTAHSGTMEWSREPEFKVVLRWPLSQPRK